MIKAHYTAAVACSLVLCYLCIECVTAEHTQASLQQAHKLPKQEKSNNEQKEDAPSNRLVSQARTNQLPEQANATDPPAIVANPGDLKEITGRVFLATGLPASGAIVKIASGEDGSTLCKPDGSFVLALSKGNNFDQLRIDHPEGSATLSVVSWPDQQDLGIIYLNEVVRVNGVLLDETNRPVPGAKLSFDDGSITVATDILGRFYDLVLAVGSHDVHVTEGPCFGLVPRRIDVTTNDTPTLQFRAKIADTITGKVVDQVGAGLPGATIVASAEPLLDLPLARSQENGLFHLALPKGRWDLVIERVGYIDKVVPIDMPIARPIEITLARRIGVEVRIQFEGKPTDIQRIEVIRERKNSGKPIVVASSTEQTGFLEYSVAVESDGERRIRAYAEGYWPALSEPFETTRNSIISVVFFEKATLKVVSKSEGAPVEGSWVQIKEVTKGGGSSDRQAVTNFRQQQFRQTWAQSTRCETPLAKCNKSGMALIRGLETGTYELRVRHPNYAISVLKTVEINFGEKLKVVMCDLPLPGTIRGSVRYFGSKPFRIIAVNAEGEFWQTHVRQDKSYEFEGLAEDSYLVRPIASRADCVRLSVGGQPVDMSLTGEMYLPSEGTSPDEETGYPVAVIGGKVTEYDLEVQSAPVTLLMGRVSWGGECAPGLEILLRSSGGKFPRRVVRTLTDEEGRFESNVLRGEECLIAVMQNGLLLTEKRFAFTRETESVEIEAPLVVISGLVAAEGKPVEDATIAITGLRSERGDRTALRTRFASGSAGEFICSHLLPGKYHVEVVAMGCRRDERVVLVEDEGVLDMRFDLQAGGWCQLQFGDAVPDFVVWKYQFGSEEYEFFEGTGVPTREGSVWIELGPKRGGQLFYRSCLSGVPKGVWTRVDLDPDQSGVVKLDARPLP